MCICGRQFISIPPLLCPSKGLFPWMKGNPLGRTETLGVLRPSRGTCTIDQLTPFEAGVNVNLSEILRWKKRKLFLDHQTVDPHARAPQVVRGLFGCPSTYF